MRVTRDAAEPPSLDKPVPRRPAAFSPCEPQADFASRRFLSGPTPRFGVHGSPLGSRRELQRRFRLNCRRQSPVVVQDGRVLRTANASRRSPRASRVGSGLPERGPPSSAPQAPPPLRQPDPVITAAPSVEGSDTCMTYIGLFVNNYFPKISDYRHCLTAAAPSPERWRSNPIGRRSSLISKPAEIRSSRRTEWLSGWQAPPRA